MSQAHLHVEPEVIEKQIRQQLRKRRIQFKERARASALGVTLVHGRNNTKRAIATLRDNPRYTGACRSNSGCSHCRGDE